MPSKSLALAIAAEWHWQSGRSVRPFTMPLMGLVATAIDQMSQPEVRAFHVRKLLEFFPRRRALPPRARPGGGPSSRGARRRQELARRELGGDLEVSTSIFGADPPEAVLGRNAEKRLNGMDAFELTATFNARRRRSLLIGWRHPRRD